eukprot:Tbor_TRINITY_DN5729_c1_g1::TRINITY_DN5729_c1_g1_i3::g.19690::m.19690
MSSSASRHLIIFGLRGTLIERLHSSRVSPLMPQSTHTVGMHKIWTRNYLTESLTALSKNCDLAIWSSTTTRNTIPVISAVFGNDHPFKFVWTREQTKPDDFRRSMPYDAEDENSTVKDLKEVFRHFPQYTPQHTIIIDDTPSKCRINAENYLWMRGLEGDGDSILRDDELQKLVTFVENKAMKTDDVRKLLPYRL